MTDITTDTPLNADDDPPPTPQALQRLADQYAFEWACDELRRFVRAWDAWVAAGEPRQGKERFELESAVSTAEGLVRAVDDGAASLARLKSSRAIP